MTLRLLAPFAASIVVVCVFLPTSGLAQMSVGVGVGVGPGLYPPGYFPPGGLYGPGGYSRGTYPGWNYPGLPGGPYTTYPYPYLGWPGYRGAYGSFWTNGLSLYGPPVPVYGPIPGVFGNNDLVNQWKHAPTLGFGVGWFGIYSPSPKGRHYSVNPWAVVEPVPGAGGPAAAAEPGGCLILSVKLPQPAAEVFVDGVKTAQTGTDRIFESPPLEAGKEFAYELTARWVERGVTVERKKTVTGKPGEVVRVDFTAGDVVVGK